MSQVLTTSHDTRQALRALVPHLEAAQLALNNARAIATAAGAELTALLAAPLTPAAALAAATARAEAAEATLQVAQSRLLSIRRQERRARRQAVAA